MRILRPSWRLENASIWTLESDPVSSLAHMIYRRVGLDLDALLELSFALFLLAPGRGGDRGVGSALEDPLTVKGTLAEGRPALCIVIVLVGGLGGDGGDLVLDLVELLDELGDASSAVAVDWMPVSALLDMPRVPKRQAQREAGEGMSGKN